MIKFLSNIANIGFVQKLLLAIHRNPHVLYYHMVGETKPPYYYNQPITRDEFIKQIDFLKNHDFEFVPLSEIDVKEKSKKRVAITTDDGFIENYSVIAPILSEKQITASFFLLNNCIDNHDLMWRNKLMQIEYSTSKKRVNELIYRILKEQGFDLDGKNTSHPVYDLIPMKQKENIVNEVWQMAGMPVIKEFLEQHKPYMNSAQIIELMNAGFTIGSHTYSHPDCSLLSFEDLKHEICESINELSMRFKTKIDFFAYPFGKRPSKDIENELIKISKAKAFLGTKNADSGYGNSIWERDKMEQAYNKSLFWFSILPPLRKLVLRPFGIYK